MCVYFLHSYKLMNFFMYFDVLKMSYLLLIWCQNTPSGARQTFWNWLLFHFDTSPIAFLAYSLSSMTNIPRSCFFFFQIFSGFFWCKMFFRHQHLNCGVHFTRASQVALGVKNLPANAGGIREVCSIPGLGRSLVEGHGNPLQYSCLENSMDRGA